MFKINLKMKKEVNGKMTNQERCDLSSILRMGGWWAEADSFDD